MKKTLSALLLSLSAILSATAGELAPSNSELVLEDSFDRAELGEGWNPTTGEWTIVDSVLHARELPADKHSAAARRGAVTQNAVYELRFRLTGECKGFHFGFDPAAGELDKKGHLFSVIVAPDSWRILKHIDKAKPQEDPNETLAQQDTAFEMGEWYTLRVSTWGPHVTATIGGERELAEQAAPRILKASHPSFSVKKPTLVFRCLGDGVEIDDIKVWALKP